MSNYFQAKKAYRFESGKRRSLEYSRSRHKAEISLAPLKSIGMKPPMVEMLFRLSTPVWHWDINSGDVDVNDDFRHRLGLDVLNLDELLSIMTNDCGEQLLETVHQGLQDRRPFFSDINIEIAEGRRDLMLWICPLEDVDGYDSIVGVIHDRQTVGPLNALKHSDLLFESLYTNSSISTMIVDAQGTLVRYNPACGELFGFLPEHEKPSTGVYNIFLDPQIQSAENFNAWGEAFFAGRQFEFETSYVCAWVSPSRRFELSVKVTPIKNSSGEIVYVLLQHTDQSHTRRVERTLFEREQLLTSIINNTRSAITVKNLEGEYLLANQEYYHLLPEGTSDVVGKTDFDIYEPHAALSITEKDREIGEQIKSSSYVETAVDHNETKRTYWAERFPISSGDGVVSAVGNIITDITAQKEFEKTLQKQRVELQVLLDTIPDVIWYLDRQGRVKKGNRRAEDSCHVPTCEGKYFADLYPQWRDVDLSQREILLAISSGESQRHRIEFQDTENGSYAYQVDRIPTLDDRQQVTGLLLVMKDITVDLRRERSLQESESRYRAFIANNFQAMFRLDFSPPIKIDQPIEEQEKQIYENGVLRECNKALSDILGSPNVEDINGRMLSQVAKHSMMNIKGFIQANYRFQDNKFSFVKFNGERLSLQLSVIGITEDGYLHRAWGTCQDVTEQNRYLDKLEYQASHDSLTQLPNRNGLYAEIESALKARQEDEKQALMLIDLDCFKEINDTLGHQYGDLLLKQVGPRLESEGAEFSAFVARLGGDEFAVFFPDVGSQKNAEIIANRILDSIREPFVVEDLHTEISASIGVSIAPDQGLDVSTLMRYADVAMYHAKEKRHGVSVYQHNYDLHSPKRLALMSDLGRALRENELQLYFQVKVDINDRKAYGFEALLRWHHPELGFVPPAEFIPLVEMTDLVRPMTLWVLENTIKQARQWQKAGYDFVVAANLSAQNLVDESLVDTIEELLQRYGLPAKCLELEITESAVMADPQRALKHLNQICELGVSLSIDDFGTGYSSLAYLKRLPVKTLKIDSSFVFNMLSDEQDAIIVNSTINLAHNLGLNVVAEGVEDEHTLTRLQEMGCDRVQGYFIGRPAPVDVINEMLKSDLWP